jgi:hypothetical protein
MQIGDAATWFGAAGTVIAAGGGCWFGLSGRRQAKRANELACQANDLAREAVAEARRSAEAAERSADAAEQSVDAAERSAVAAERANELAEKRSLPYVDWSLIATPSQKFILRNTGSQTAYYVRIESDAGLVDGAFHEEVGPGGSVSFLVSRKVGPHSGDSVIVRWANEYQESASIYDSYEDSDFGEWRNVLPL